MWRFHNLRDRLLGCVPEERRRENVPFLCTEPEVRKERCLGRATRMGETEQVLRDLLPIHSRIGGIRKPRHGFAPVRVERLPLRQFAHGKREGDGEAGALARLALDLDLAVVGLDDFADDGEAQPRAFAGEFAGVARAEELLE